MLARTEKRSKQLPYWCSGDAEPISPDLRVQTGMSNSQSRRGEIAGDEITLETERDGHTIRFDLVWAGDRITGEANLPGESSAKARLDLVRMK